MVDIFDQNIRPYGYALRGKVCINLVKIAAVMPTSSPNHATSKREKFVKLAESRTTNAIKAIRTIGKLGNKNAYEYNEEDVKKIAKALNDEIDTLKSRMISNRNSDDADFKL